MTDRGYRTLDDRSIIVISGPGGVGKGTIVDQLLAQDERLWLSRSWTTRAPRPGEAADAYHFVDCDAFQARVDAGGFLEWVEFLGYRLGSPIPEPPGGVDVILEIDVSGGAQVSAVYPETLLVFVEAPNRAAQEARLRSRGDPAYGVRARLDKAASEAATASSLGYTVVVNDDLPNAVTAIEDLIRRDRGRRGRAGEEV